MSEWNDVQLFEAPAAHVTLWALWTADDGWQVAVRSITAYEHPALPDEVRQDPTTSYDHLSTAELVDVITAEIDRRRRF